MPFTYGKNVLLKLIEPSVQSVDAAVYKVSAAEHIALPISSGDDLKGRLAPAGRMLTDRSSTNLITGERN